MKNTGFLRLQRNLLSQPDVANMYAEEGATGLGLYIAINFYLSYCEGGWGSYTSGQLTSLAVAGRRHRGDVKRIVEDYDLFIIDGTRFTSHWMQRQFGKAGKKLPHSCVTPAHTSSMRAEDIEVEIEKEIKEKGRKVSDVIGPSAYEKICRAGLRHGSHGEPVPWWAPPQTDIRCCWSLCADCWLPPEGIDPKAERLRRKEMSDGDFMMKTAYETLTEQEHQRIQDHANREL